jgi:hypothetical protein
VLIYFSVSGAMFLHVRAPGVARLGTSRVPQAQEGGGFSVTA